ncbi:hypothetical protein LINPERPRIM_LOCUS6838 [Linum perenne]
MYEHKVESCLPPNNAETVTPPEKEDIVGIQEVEVAKQSEAKGNCGSWMIVKRRQRKPTNSQATSTKPKQDHGSRFEVLSEHVPQVESVLLEHVSNSSQPPGDASDTVVMAAALKDLLNKALKTKSANGKLRPLRAIPNHLRISPMSLGKRRAIFQRRVLML